MLHGPGNGWVIRCPTDSTSTPVSGRTQMNAVLYGPLGAPCFEELQHRLMEATADLDGSDGADTAEQGNSVQPAPSAARVRNRS